MGIVKSLTDVEAELRANSIQVKEAIPIGNGTGTQLKLDGTEFEHVNINCYDSGRVVVQGSNPSGIEKVKRVLE